MTAVSSLRGERGRRSSGFSYTEVLVTVVLIVLLLVPGLEALSTSVASSSVYTDKVTDQYRLIGKLEETLAESFNDLAAAAAAAGSDSTPTSYSDPVGPSRRVVFIASYDADDADSDGNPFTGGEVDLLWVRVEIENSDHGVETLTRM